MHDVCQNISEPARRNTGLYYLTLKKYARLMKILPNGLILALLLGLAACSQPTVEEAHFNDAKELRQSSLFKKGVIPEDFVDIFPPSVRDIYYVHSSADTISHMKFRLTKLPGDYFTLISRMELALEPEVQSLQPFEPAGVEWWDPQKVNNGFSTDSFVFRKLPLGVGDAVYIAASEIGEVYVWLDEGGR